MALKNNFKRQEELKKEIILERFILDFKGTVAAGQGELKEGQLLAYDETDGLYYKYIKGDSKKGTAATVLIYDIDTTGTNITTSLLAGGAVDKDLIIDLAADDYKAINDLRKYNIYIREVK